MTTTAATQTDTRTDATWLASLPAHSLYELRSMTADRILAMAPGATADAETDVLAIINTEVNRRLA